jgi:pimeloyl-ACP methyl ester carboxylesterase
LDWGGTGPPLVLLAGGGVSDDAHDFDAFAPRLTSLGHVYGITRRGFGASGPPDTAYDANVLGDDILAVLDSLKLTKPVLIGHSLAGEELSSIGSRQPGRVAGLVYLDAAFPYAFYDTTTGNLQLELVDLRRKIERLTAGPFANYKEYAEFTRQLADVDLPRVQRSLRGLTQSIDSAGPRAMLPQKPPYVLQQLIAGHHMFTHVDAPVLAIYAAPHREASPNARAFDSTTAVKLAASVQRAAPSAQIIFIRNASHAVWQTNADDVYNAIRDFVRSMSR